MTETASSRRSITVDIMKGLAIVVVVFAHVTLGLNKVDIVSDHFIYSSMPMYLWYMATFFFATGLFVERGLKREGAGPFIWKKALELGYPFVIWSFIFGLTQMVFSSYTNTGAIPFSEVVTGLLPWAARDHMWFLPALFLALAVTAASFKLGGRHWKPLLFTVGLGMSALVMVLPAWNQQLQYTLWVAVAVLLAPTVCGTWIKAASASIRSLSFFAVVAAAFVMIALSWVGPGRDFYDDMPSLVVASAIGILGLVSLSRITAALPGIGTSFARVGQWSLHIYLTHVPVLAAVRVATTRVLDINSGAFITVVSVVICVAVGCLFGLLDDRGFLSFLFRPPAPLKRKLTPGRSESIQVG